MAKGQIAKDLVIEKIQKTFGTNYLGEYDKKYYVNSTENGEVVQVAISLTCPKNPFPGSGTMDFAEASPAGETASVATTNAELTQSEKDNVANLIKALGL